MTIIVIVMAFDDNDGDSNDVNDNDNDDDDDGCKNMTIGTCETIFSCMRLMHMDMSPMPNRM